MNEQPLRRDWFYWVIVVFTVLQIPFFVITALDFVLHPWAPDMTYKSELFRLVLGLVIVPAQLGISLFIIRRAPTNVCGLFLMCWAISLSGETFRVDTPIAPYNSLNFAWYGLWALLLFFPNGRIVPRAFEGIVRITFVVAIITAMVGLLAVPTFSGIPGTYINPKSVPNPIFVSSLTGLLPLLNLALLITVVSWLILIIPLGVVRIRRSSPQELLQIKWVIWVFLLVIIALFMQIASGVGSRPIGTMNSSELALQAVFSVFSGIFPFVAIAIAILRHRLYDIDIIIRRTLVYATLTTLLAVVYFGGIILIQRVFQLVTGQNSDLAVVMSTLLIVALFTPLRRVVQNWIDRRFYRRKYDSEQTIAKFNETLRDEVDLETLKVNLIGVVQETLQPSSIRLWVKE